MESFSVTGVEGSVEKGGRVLLLNKPLKLLKSFLYNKPTPCVVYADLSRE